MSANTLRYMIENHGPDREAIKTVFAGAAEVCAQLGITEITLLVSVKGSFPRTVVGEFLGDGAAKALCKGQSIRFAGDIMMNLESVKSFAPYKSFEMVVGIYLSGQDTNVLDSASSAKAIVLLPWTEEEGRRWAATWSPTVLGGSTWQVQRASLPADAEELLLRLTHVINLSTGLSHPSDKEYAKKMLAELKQRGYRLAPEDVRQWAVRHDWAPKHAEDLAKLATRCFR